MPFAQPSPSSHESSPDAITDASVTDVPDGHEDTVYPGKVLFVAVHLACFAALFTGVTRSALLLALLLYVARMFGVTAGYHRYFSHRTFKTSRVMQFLLAFLAQSSAQKGTLWWASKHRHHHRYSDTEHDVHSPRHDGFWHSHVGWIFAPQWDLTDYAAVPDLAAYPELVWLNKYEHVPTLAVLALCAWLEGWTGVVVGFCWSTVLTWHGTFMINSLAHVHGSQRYVTGDDSRNNWWLALLTLGEGWHNNHHAYQRSTRQGFRWYEVDITYYVLRVMSWGRLVWDLGDPPEAVVRNERPLGRAVLEKVARQLAGSFNIDQLAADARRAQLNAQQQLAELRHTAEDRLADMRHSAEDRLAEMRLSAEDRLAEMRHTAEDRLAEMRHSAEDRLAELRQQAGGRLADMRHSAEDRLAGAMAQVVWPTLPTREELRARAQVMLPSTPSLDAISERAHELLSERVAARLAALPGAT